MFSDDATTTTFEDVIVVRDSGLAVGCTVDGKHVWVPRIQILPGSQVARPGDRGRLVIPHWLAVELNLA